MCIRDSIDPDSPGLEIFNVYEEGERAPYGWALRDAETGDVRFGEYAEEDLGRCMIGKIDPNTRGLQVWVKDCLLYTSSGWVCQRRNTSAICRR